MVWATSCLLFRLVFLCLISRSSSFLNQPNTWSRPQRRIQGRVFSGENAKDGDYPFMASLKKGSWHFCGASILSDQIILTAAHCWIPIWDNPQFRVKVGFHQKYDDKRKIAHYFEAEQFIRHEAYQETADHKGYLTGFDVALIKLKKPINFTAFGSLKVAKVCIPSSSDQPVGKECEVIGWGRTEHTLGRWPDNILRSATVQIMSPAACLRAFPIKKKGDFICTKEFKNGACAGDSGGPLICPVAGDTDTWLQFGVVSFGARSCRDAPSVYASVPVYSQWIIETAGKLLTGQPVTGMHHWPTTKPPPTTKKPE